LRIDPKFKDSLRVAAANEHRSIANMVEVLIRDYCERNDIAICERSNPINVQLDDKEVIYGA
jgi:hypothetical protein